MFGALSKIILSTAVFALVLGALLFPWVQICRCAGKPGWRGLIGHWTKQLWGVLGLAGFVAGGAIGLVSAALAPIPFIFLGTAYLLTFRELLTSFAAVPAVFAVFVFLFMFRHPSTREVSFGVSLLVLFLGLLLAAERGSQAAMACRAEAHEMARYERNSLLWSLKNVPGEYETDPHAVAWKEGMLFYWSYREMDWYQVLPDIGGTADKPIFDCAAKTP